MFLNVLFTLAVLFPSMSIAFALTELDAKNADSPDQERARGGMSHDLLGLP